MQPIFTTAGIRAIEQAATTGIGSPGLMERAGLAAAEYARRVMPERARNVLVVAGPGNNGGDAFELAVHLRRWFYRVTVVFAGQGASLSRDAAAALRKWEAAGGTFRGEIPGEGRWDFVIDGLFGIGLVRPLAGRHAELVERMNGAGVPVLSLDVPSGINADTGTVMGMAVRATHTITFIALKPGLLTLDGPDHCGILKVDTLGGGLERFKPQEGRLITSEVLESVLPPRPRNYHKGHAGSVGILGGAQGMSGAALLAGRAALLTGAGRVYVGMLAEHAPGLDPSQPELMLCRPEDVLDGSMSVLAAGPGMGSSPGSKALLEKALHAETALVLDADALNLIAANGQLGDILRGRTGAALLTPHPAEAARLLGTDTRSVQADRLAAVKAIASRYGCAVALKGNGTVVADRDGAWWINSSGNAGMASAGMGDALTGIVAGLAAQGAEPLAALTAGVFLHGSAADALLAQGHGPLGITASEVIASARLLLNKAIYQNHVG